MLTNINKEWNDMKDNWAMHRSVGRSVERLFDNVVVYKFVKRHFKLDRFDDVNIEKSRWTRRDSTVVCLPTKSNSEYWYDISQNEGEVYITSALAMVWFKEADDERAKKAIADALTEYYNNQIKDYLDKIEKAESNRTKTIEALT